MKENTKPDNCLGNQKPPLGGGLERSPGSSERGLGCSFFHFCPQCGSGRFVPNDFKSMRCEDCGFVYYLNPSAATAAFIMNSKGELLVTRRALKPAKGTFDLPGGFCDIGETLQEGVAREVKEETGLTVVSSKFLFSLPNKYVYSGFTVPTLDSFFLCRVDDDSVLHANDDAASAFWIAKSDIRPEQFGLGSIRRAVTIALQHPSIVGE